MIEEKWGGDVSYKCCKSLSGLNLQGRPGSPDGGAVQKTCRLKATDTSCKIKCRELQAFIQRWCILGNKHDTDAHQMDVLTQVWQCVYGWAGLASCEKADGLSLALSFFLGGHLVQTRTVDKLKWDLHSHVHSDVPDVPSSPCSPALPHHFSLLRWLWSVAIHPSDYHFLFHCFFPFSLSLLPAHPHFFLPLLFWLL